MNSREAVLNERISQGPLTKRYDDTFAQSLGVPYGVAATSGSASIPMALMALGSRAGDEVFVPCTRSVLIGIVTLADKL